MKDFVFHLSGSDNKINCSIQSMTKTYGKGKDKDKGLSTGAIIGITIGSVVGALLLLGAAIWYHYMVLEPANAPLSDGKVPGRGVGKWWQNIFLGSNRKGPIGPYLLNGSASAQAATDLEMDDYTKVEDTPKVD